MCVCVYVKDPREIIIDTHRKLYRPSKIRGNFQFYNIPILHMLFYRLRAESTNNQRTTNKTKSLFLLLIDERSGERVFTNILTIRTLEFFFSFGAKMFCSHHCLIDIYIESNATKQPCTCLIQLVCFPLAVLAHSIINIIEIDIDVINIVNTHFR